MTERLILDLSLFQEEAFFTLVREIWTDVSIFAISYNFYSKSCFYVTGNH